MNPDFPSQTCGIVHVSPAHGDGVGPGDLEQETGSPEAQA